MITNKNLILKRQICQDIINVIKSGEANLVNNSYILTNEPDVSKLNLGNCKVCALGSILLSYLIKTGKSLREESMGIRNTKEYNLYYTPMQDIPKILKGMFTEEELNEIEVAYEGSDVNDYYFEKDYSGKYKTKNYNEKDGQPQGKLAKLEHYKSQFNSNEEILTGIMNNIIENGRFKV